MTKKQLSHKIENRYFEEGLAVAKDFPGREHPYLAEWECEADKWEDDLEQLWREWRETFGDQHWTEFEYESEDAA